MPIVPYNHWIELEPIPPLSVLFNFLRCSDHLSGWPKPLRTILVRPQNENKKINPTFYFLTYFSYTSRPLHE